MNIAYADNLNRIPPYPFVELTKKKRMKIAAGEDIIDLGIGDPDLPTPQGIRDAMKKAIDDSSTHRYPMDAGRKDFREAWAKWCKDRFGINLEANGGVQALIGAKEGLANLVRAFVDRGDKTLVPDPAYPVYKNGGTILTGGEPVLMPLLEENGFLPDFSAVSRADARAAKLLFIDYPNNPTGAVADKAFYKEVVDFAKDNEIIVVSDLAYSEIYYDGYKPPSFFEVKGAMDVGIEFHSFSKTYNMTGWRLGVAYGNPDIVAGLSRVKENLDSGVFEAVQVAGVYAMENYKETPALAEYDKRMNTLVDAFNQAGFDAAKPKATMYFWGRVPDGETSVDFSNRILDEANIVLTPGSAFGKYGEGYFRASITSSSKRIEEAAERIKALGK